YKSLYDRPQPSLSYSLGTDEKERLIGLASRLHQRVVAQDQAVSAVAEAILRYRAGLGRAQQPTGSFLFLGPTDQLFDDEKLMIRIDVSKYVEQHCVSRLIGAPPGYVGHEEGGEKAHPSVFNTLLQMLDDGRLTDGHGRTVDFTNTVIIMTSNLGAEYMLKGFSGKTTMDNAREMVIQEDSIGIPTRVKTTFRMSEVAGILLQPFVVPRVRSLLLKYNKVGAKQQQTFIRIIFRIQRKQ
ncbi:hypothetical protein M8C21_025358, partial [Ambrosia artemisiifolia]